VLRLNSVSIIRNGQRAFGAIVVDLPTGIHVAESYPAVVAHFAQFAALTLIYP
jgi:hypothetical protein